MKDRDKRKLIEKVSVIEGDAYGKRFTSDRMNRTMQ